MAEPVCPECGKSALPQFAPFCSKRCQQIDLGRWLRGDFVIPGSPVRPPAPDDSEDDA